jgi:chemotaxis protein MotB
MTHSTRRSTASLVALLLAASAGCVTKGKYEDLEADRNRVAAERTDLQGRVTQLEAQNAALDQKSRELGAQVSASQAQMAEMKGTYDQLVNELKGEVASGAVQIQQLVDGVRLNVSDELLFPSGSALLNEGGRSLIARVAEQIKGGDSIVSVEGHTDNAPIGPSLKKLYPTNWELAGARAAAVVRELSDHGVDPLRLRAVSLGPFSPVASNDSAEGRAKNRRTEILLRPVPK